MGNDSLLPSVAERESAECLLTLDYTQAEEFDFGDNVDIATFEQILDMDEGEEDDGHEFSKSIVFGFLEQADQTFAKMENAK